ncbi:Pirin-like protein [Zea mays]|uniref:Pirin-like protein n=1 Tax=Zea mays TaxID=4577 RepID=A0A317YCJ2_MAIZE|nr:Pirin-like protein [Zea mays]
MFGGADGETRRSWSYTRLWLLVVCALTSLSVGVVVSKPTGFSDHPHRGFETVTYMLEGHSPTRTSLGTRTPSGQGTCSG